jgi:hypothetical protein
MHLLFEVHNEIDLLIPMAPMRSLLGSFNTQAWLTLLELSCRRFWSHHALAALCSSTTSACALDMLLFNILRAGVDSVCYLPGASYMIPFCRVPESNHESKYNALESLQTGLVNVQSMCTKGVTLPMQFEHTKNVIREVAGIVGHSNLPST